MRHLPYILARFILLPLVIWLGLALPILPPSTTNPDLPLVALITATCIPVLA
ncbi:MAG: hypothetical protein ACFB13_21830 [Kiloniellaceae bacterium]